MSWLKVQHKTCFIIERVNDKSMQLLRKTVEGIWVWIPGAPGGLLGTADACPEPLPYHDSSARHSATLLTLSLSLSPSFCLSLLLSLSPSTYLWLSPEKSATSQKNRSGNIFGSMGASLFLIEAGQLIACVYEIFSLLTSPLSYFGSGWRVWHIQYCVYGYWRQPGQWLFFNVFNPVTDTIN